MPSRFYFFFFFFLFLYTSQLLEFHILFSWFL
jgi:hypothetical protein